MFMINILHSKGDKEDRTSSSLKKNSCMKTIIVTSSGFHINFISDITSFGCNDFRKVSRDTLKQERNLLTNSLKVNSKG